MKKYNIGISIILLVISAAMFITASGMPVMDGIMGAGTWPQVLSVVMGILALLLLIQSLGDHSGEKSPFEFGPGLKRVLLGILILVVFCILLSLVGFMIAAAFMIPAIMFLMGERRVPLLAGVTVGVLLCVYLIFSVALNLPLPQGMFL